jgi:glycosyltransferase involved in cell wall biosynthesis
MNIVNEFSPCVLHAHWWIPGGWVARSIVKDQRLIVTSHGTDVRLLDKKAWMRPLAAHVFRRASVITTVSGWMASSLGERFPAVHDKIEVAPMPPEDSVFGGAVRESVNQIPVILCVTRYTVQKRNHVLLRALERLRSSGLDFRCRLIGDGGSERERAAATIDELGLRQQVEMIPSMSQTQLAEEYRRADVTVLPAVGEGFGLTLVEAQLSGCAVVGARSGGITDIITQGESGLLVNPDDADDLAGELHRILSDPTLRIHLARGGQRSAQSKFSSRAIVDRFLQWYQLG